MSKYDAQPVTLSEAVCACISRVLSVGLEREVSVGRSNRTDYYGKHPQLGEIRVECELRREDPVNNVAKAWWQAGANTDESFTLIQVFSGFYRKKKSKRDIAKFVGERMHEWAEQNNRDIKYAALSIDYEPPEGSGDPMLQAEKAKDTYDQIRPQLQKLRTGGMLDA